MFVRGFTRACPLLQAYVILIYEKKPSKDEHLVSRKDLIAVVRTGKITLDDIFSGLIEVSWEHLLFMKLG